MKKPRIEDFDPSAVPDLGSPLDDMPTIERRASAQSPLNHPVTAPVMPQDGSPIQSPPIASPTSGDPSLQLPGDPPVHPYGRTSVRRTITRYAFEFFQDQIETLRKFALEEKLRNEKGSMSEMVREAVDMYLAKRFRTDTS